MRLPHLPHPHLPQLWHRGLSADDLTTSAAVARWAEWTPTHTWMAEHGRNEGETR
ncbi:hypothetical protein [Nocardia abscessus]|uniref:hypothetical protein n=1 Tax=Nocardia abscessus TaxID=120957 RepID=UPI0002F431F7|nr:hypothetical protein [Nocardia abscessus]MCC3333529.1 hypothetical protein [Nocardia abscessus]